ncbi:MAG: sigma-70 family RNA polymerase sigma factor [Chthonomonadales bacterium]|nr:sigma-70 family RNA polymerase sigma factor [Chthonomonadales bacterium]
MQVVETGKFALQYDVSDFDRMLRDHHRRAFSFAYRMTGNREDAEDLTQDAFIRAYRAFDRYDRTRPFDRWLFRIIANLFVDRLRAKPRQTPLSLDTPMEGDDGDSLFSEIPDEEADPSNVILKEVMDERLQAALNALPPQFRQTVLLTDLEGMSYDEAAEVLECAVGTIRSRLHRARVMMRDTLAGKGTRRRRSRASSEMAPLAA